MTNIVAIIQARMGSTRLPGKVLREIIGKPLLEYQIERLNESKRISKIVIATTSNESDYPIVELGGRLGVTVFRGSEDDVLSRYHGAAKKEDADIIVRLTSDCPVIDPNVVDNVIEYYLAHDYDYVSNSLKRSYPRGMDTEVFSFDVLEDIKHKVKSQVHREHVTPYIYQNPDQYTIGHVYNSRDESRHRWTVDTLEDFLLIELMIESLYPQNKNFTLEDMIELNSLHPEWAAINGDIEQKKLGE